MKLFLLKRKLHGILLLLSFAAVGTMSNQLYGNKIEDPYHEQMEKTLLNCVCNRTNQQSFTYFVDQLIKILQDYKTFLETHQSRSKIVQQNGGITINVIQNFIRDLQKIRNSKNVMQIGLVLAKYKKFLPGDMKRMTLPHLAAGLRYRLRVSTQPAPAPAA